MFAAACDSIRETYSSQNEIICERLAQVSQQGEYLAIEPTLSVSQSSLRVIMSSLVTVGLLVCFWSRVRGESLPYIVRHNL
jgi:hypothetical protein